MTEYSGATLLVSVVYRVGDDDTLTTFLNLIKQIPVKYMTEYNVIHLIYLNNLSDTSILSSDQYLSRLL